MQKTENSPSLPLRIFCAILLVVVALFIVPASALTLTAGEPQSSTPVIAKGDPVYIQGTATGHPQQGLQVWLIGNNYARVSTISVNADNSYEFELRASETQNLAPGQYFVLVQHPMMNGQFDITYNAGTGQVINRQLGGGTAIFSLTGPGSLQGSAGAAALVRAVNDQNIDDTFTSVSFYVEQPDAFIDPVGEHAVGDTFTIGGSTNLAVGDDLLVEVYSSSFRPTTKQQGGEFSGASGVVKVEPGTGRYNRWSFPVDAATWKPDEYIVTVSAVLQDVKGSATFTITGKRTPATILPASATTTTAPPATVVTTVAAPAPTTQTAPVPVGVIIGGLAGSFLLTCRYFRDKL